MQRRFADIQTPPFAALLVGVWLVTAGCGKAAPPQGGNGMSTPAPAGEIGTAAAVYRDEFIGPFPSWANVKTDYGAAGDGVADDTAAIQRALDALRNPDTPKRVLYFPAGTYRIAETIELLRETHTESQGVSIYGEDPESTIIRWDGPEGGAMFQYNPWFSVMGRLTLDGGGTAHTAIHYVGATFSTYNELSDLIVKDVEFGIRAGRPHGIAETAVLRCRFIRCATAAISVENFNTLDWYVWHSWFEDCGIGVTNEFGAGNFYVYESSFLRSTETDLTIRHTGWFTAYRNTSVGSRRFLHAKRADNWTDAETWGSNFTLQENVVLDPTDAIPVVIDNNGPNMLLDNVFRINGEGPVVRNLPPSERADLVAIGNAWTVENAIEVRGRLTELDNRTVSRAEIEDIAPAPAPFLPRTERPVIAVEAGADAAAIQAAIDQAAAELAGQRPVVHLPAGAYAIRETLVIPEGADLQLVGDGAYRATTLNWAGGGDGPVLRIAGPSKATLRNLNINAGNSARAIVADNCDQPGSRVFTDQLLATAYEYSIVVEGLDEAYVAFQNVGHNAIRVSGGPRATVGEDVPGLTAILCGASSRHTHHKIEGISLYALDRGARFLVRDIWYEGDSGFIFDFTDSGTFTYLGGHIAPFKGPDASHAYPDGSQIVPYNLEGFRGRVTLTQLFPISGPLRVRGTEALDVLLMGMILRDVPLRIETEDSGVAFLHGKEFRADGTGLDSLPDQGRTDDPDFLRKMLDMLRSERPRPLSPVPDGATDLRLYRIMAHGLEALRIQGTP